MTRQNEKQNRNQTLIHEIYTHSEYLKNYMLEPIYKMKNNLLPNQDWERKNLFEYLCFGYHNDKYNIFDKTSGKVLSTEERKNLLDEIIFLYFQTLVNPETKEITYTPKSYTEQFSMNILNNLCCYTSLEVLQKFELYFVNLLNPGYKFTWFNDTKFSLMKSALHSSNYEIAHWLFTKYQHSFFENIQVYNLECHKTPEVNYILDMIETEPITEYLKFDESDIDYYFIYFRSCKLIITCLQQIINYWDVEKKNKLLNHLVEYYLEQENLTVIKFMLGNSYLQDNFLSIKTTNDWTEYLIKVVYDNFGNYSSNIKKTKIIKSVFTYVEEKTLIYEDIILYMKEKNYDYLENGESPLCCFIKLPHIVPFLQKINILDFKNLENVPEVIYNLVRYGTYETYLFYLESINEIMLDGFNYKNYLRNYEFNVSNIVTYSLCNKDIRIFKSIISFFDTPDKVRDLYHIDCRFVLLPKLSLEQKRKRINILLKYNRFDSVRHDIFFQLKSIKTNHSEITPHIIEFTKWCFKKFYSKIEDSLGLPEYKTMCCVLFYVFDSEFIFDFYEKNRLQGLNYYYLVIEGINNGFFWYDEIIQKALSYCKPLKGQHISIIKELKLALIKMKVPNNFKIVDKMVKYLISIGFDFNTSYYNLYGLNYFMIDVARYSNSILLKALIFNGVSIDPIIQFYRNGNYNIYYYSLMKRWIAMYYLVKRLEFKIRYRNQKKHQLEYKSTVIDILSRPPNFKENKPVLEKGGNLYYRDLDEFNNMLGNSEIKLPKAKHIEPLELLAWLQSPDSIWSQKADGTLVENMGNEKDNVFPPLSENYEFVSLDAEYIPELDLHLVFNSRSHQNSFTNLLDDYFDLKQEHPYAKSCSIENSIILESDTPEIMEAKLEKEFKSIIDFCKKYSNVSNKWWPKTIYSFNIHDVNLKFKMLDIVQKYQSKLYTQYLKDNSNLAQSYFPTDGMILMRNYDKKNYYKLKPDYQMTADLLIDNKIHRCIWNREDMKWESREIRNDKNHPNPVKIVKQLERFHRNPWTLEHIKYFINSNPYYQVQGKKDKYVSEFVKECQTVTQEYIQKNIVDSINHSQDRILDIGCGFGQKGLWKHKHLKIDGIDNEIKIWIESESKSNLKSKHRKIYHDITQKCQQSNNLVFQYYNDCQNSFFQNLGNLPIIEYKYITAWMSWHNIYNGQQGINNMMAEMNKRTFPGSKLLISFLDKDTLFSEEKNINLSGGSYLNLLNSNTLQYFYSWTHQKPVQEKILTIKTLTESLKPFGWNLDSDNKDISVENKLQDDNTWGKVLSALRFASFTKI